MPGPTFPLDDALVGTAFRAKLMLPVAAAPEARLLGPLPVEAAPGPAGAKRFRTARAARACSRQLDGTHLLRPI